MRFRGREVVYRDLGQKIFDEVAQRLEDLAAIEETSPLMGNKMSIVFAPRVAK
jgi:translation initiation factor IF-3